MFKITEEVVEAVEIFSKTYVCTLDSYAQSTSIRLDDTCGAGAEVYTACFLNGTATISDVQDFEDAFAKATEYVREIFPRSYHEAEWLILNAGLDGVLKEEVWNELFPYIWDAVVEELRQDIDMAWFFMELGKKSDAEHLTAVLNSSF